MLLTKSALGLVLTVQLGIIPSKQSTIGERYTFPAGIENSVISVSTFSLGVYCNLKLINFWTNRNSKLTSFFIMLLYGFYNQKEAKKGDENHYAKV